eukprot:TRINITY_DN4560_c0_g1_i1.p1 TRINITY_DN4560_c0_g1~~TRINITY_DN4560_c0_g1_i1.p1  ORF type:complete len:341 (+),score=60.78 TRINITY_DN4560_c0_g1_i1:37-1059(+)
MSSSSIALGYLIEQVVLGVPAGIFVLLGLAQSYLWYKQNPTKNIHLHKLLPLCAMNIVVIAIVIDIRCVRGIFNPPLVLTLISISVQFPVISALIRLREFLKVVFEGEKEGYLTCHDGTKSIKVTIFSETGKGFQQSGTSQSTSYQPGQTAGGLLAAEEDGRSPGDGPVSMCQMVFLVLWFSAMTAFAAVVTVLMDEIRWYAITWFAISGLLLYAAVNLHRLRLFVSFQAEMQSSLKRSHWNGHKTFSSMEKKLRKFFTVAVCMLVALAAFGVFLLVFIRVRLSSLMVTNAMAYEVNPWVWLLIASSHVVSVVWLYFSWLPLSSFALRQGMSLRKGAVFL